jgi:hypothetical protein
MAVEQVTLSCKACGKDFQVGAWRFRPGNERYQSKYCSRPCGVKHNPPAMERFMSRVDKNGANGCWQWLGKVNNWGYGKFFPFYKEVRAHRWAYEQMVGPIPEGAVIMHSCDNPACVNPAHLSAGTLSDNSQDCLKKNRKKTAKLTVEQVREIRARLKGQPNKWKIYEAIAPDYGVQAGCIYLIHVGRTWTWVA